jgi:hypothetical protein
MKLIRQSVDSILGKGGKGMVLVCTIALSISSYIIFSTFPPPNFNFYSNSHAADYHPDEGVWTAAGKYYFEKFFLDKDWRYETWDTRKFGNFGNRNPVLVKYFVGASLFTSGKVKSGESIPGFDFEQMNWDEVRTIRPPEPVLESARVPIMITGISCVILLFLLIRSLTNSWILGLFSALMFSLQPHVISFSQKVMNDIPAVCFGLAALLVSFLALNNILGCTKRKIVLRSLAIGIVVGLALQTKLSTLLTVITIALWSAYEFILMVKDNGISGYSIIKVFYAFASFGMVLSLIWVLPNPLLYQHTVKNTYHILSLSKKVRSNPSALEEQKNTTLRKSWDSLVANGPERSGIFGHYTRLPSSLDKITLLLGMFLFVLLFARSKSHAQKRGYVYLAIWMLISTCGILFWTPFDWPRWYLPMSPVWATLQAMGIIMILALIYTSLRFWLKPAIERPRGNT